MALWIPAAALIVLGVWILVLPLFRRGSADGEDRASHDLRIAEAMLAEIDRDEAEAVISPPEATTARLEIKRRMASALNEGRREPSLEPERAERGRRRAAIVITVSVPAAAVALYLSLGSPMEPDQPFAARDTAVAGAGTGALPDMSLEEAIDRLEQRMAEQPGDPQGWRLLGRTYMTLGRYDDGAMALQRAYEVSGQRADFAVDAAEAMVVAAGGTVTADAKSLLEQAAVSGDDPRPPYYLALARAQAGDLEGALEGWTALVAASPADAPWLPSVRQQIANAAAELGFDARDATPAPPVDNTRPVVSSPPAPSQADKEAASEMTEAERAEMIQGMVERLAERLEDNPNDAEGWLRLARAYDVLGQPEKAKEARARAAAVN